MPLTINDPEIERLARELAEATGQTITEAIRTALRERAERTSGNGGAESRPIEEVFAEIWSDLPAAEWRRLPPDLTDRLDDYLYGGSSG